MAWYDLKRLLMAAAILIAGPTTLARSQSDASPSPAQTAKLATYTPSQDAKPAPAYQVKPLEPVSIRAASVAVAASPESAAAPVLVKNNSAIGKIPSPHKKVKKRKQAKQADWHKNANSTSAAGVSGAFVKPLRATQFGQNSQSPPQEQGNSTNAFSIKKTDAAFPTADRTISTPPATSVAPPPYFVSDPLSIELSATGSYLPDPRSSSTISNLMNKIAVLKQLTSVTAESAGVQFSVKYKVYDWLTVVAVVTYTDGTVKLNLNESSVITNQVLGSLPTGSIPVSVTSLASLPAPVQNIIAGITIKGVTDGLYLHSALTQLTSSAGFNVTPSAIPLPALVNAAAEIAKAPLIQAIQNSGLPAASKTAVINGVQTILSKPESIFTSLHSLVGDASAALAKGQQTVGTAQTVLTKVNTGVQAGTAAVTGATTVLNSAAAAVNQTTGVLSAAGATATTAATSANTAQANLQATLAQNFLGALAKNLPTQQGNQLLAVGSGLTAASSSAIGGGILTALQAAPNATGGVTQAAGIVQNVIGGATTGTAAAANNLAAVTAAVQQGAKDLALAQNIIGAGQSATAQAQSAITFLSNGYNNSSVNLGSLNVKVIGPMATALNALNAFVPADLMYKDGAVTISAAKAAEAAALFAKKYNQVGLEAQSQEGGTLFGVEVHPFPKLPFLFVAASVGATFGQGTLGITAVNETDQTFNLQQSVSVTGTGLIGAALAIPYVNNALEEKLNTTVTLPTFAPKTTNYRFSSVGLQGKVELGIEAVAAYYQLVKGITKPAFSPSINASIGVQGGVQKLSVKGLPAGTSVPYMLDPSSGPIFNIKMSWPILSQ